MTIPTTPAALPSVVPPVAVQPVILPPAVASPAGPKHLASTPPSFFQTTRKAFAAALAAAIVATAPVVYGDAAGGFTQDEVLACVGVFVGAAVVGFFATYLPTNIQKPASL